jgi:hypothetical protein
LDGIAPLEMAMSLRMLPAVCALLFAASGGAGAGETTWERNAGWLEEQIDGCAQHLDPDACRFFPARALDRLFGIEQMCEGESCIGPWKIAELAIEREGWTELGSASDQAVLTKAAEMARGGLAVVAIHGGMVALIMPGELFPSQRWSRNVPLAVGARVDDPAASVYAKGLNFLFSDPAKVILYVYM